MLTALRLPTLLTLGLTLAGCGGGGGGSSSKGPEQPVDPGPGPGTSGVSISGTIHIPPGTLLDVDTADPSNGAQTVHNDDASSAQTLLNPSIVGGFLSYTEGSYGISSQFSYPVDTRDVYRATFIQGQVVNLNVFDADLQYRERADGTTFTVNPDLRSPIVELRLTSVSDPDVTQEVTAHANGGASANASVTVPADGDYYVQLSTSPVTGPTTYILTIGQSSIEAYQPAITDDFVPGEAIVVWEPGFQAQSNRRVARGYTPVSGDPQRGQLIRFGLGGQGGSRALASSAVSPVLEQKRETLQIIRQFRAQPGVVSVEPNYVRKAFFTPSDPLYRLQWHYPLINLPQAWNLNTEQGEGVIVAVLDTGVLPNHPDLAGQLVAGYDFISNVTTALDGNGIDNDPTDPGDSPAGQSSYHGTHVAGTIAAATNNAGGLGVAFSAKVMPLRVLGRDGQGTDADIAQAIRYAAGLSNASGTLPAQRADIINLSLGSPAPSTVLRDAIAAARAAGVIVVAAAGNDASNQPNYPAAYDGVISVSAVGSDKRIAPYSNYGSTIDLAAPGGNFQLDLDLNGQPDGIVSSWGDDSIGKPARHTYSMMEGTSMAAPHVAGVFALMKSIDPALSPFQIDTMLEQGVLTQTSGNPEFYGKGLIDASKAVRMATDGNLQPILVAAPSALTFDALATTQEIILDNGGGGTLNVLSVTAAESTGSGWLSVAPIAADVNANGTGRYQVTIDRSGLNSNLTYAGTISVDSDQNDLSIPVLVQPVDAQRIANAGRHYLLLIDLALPDDADPVAQAALDAVEGRYAYQLTGIEPGNYLLVAGSDLDNDGLICDSGEACAVYPVRNLPQEISVTDQNLTGYDFNTGYFNDISAQASQRKSQTAYRRISGN